MQMHTLPAGLKAFAEREFLGEKLIWAERPDVRMQTLLAFGIWLFAIPWTAFALFWETAVIGPLIGEWLGYDMNRKPTSPSSWLLVAMGLFGLPFVLIGFGMLLSPYWVWRKGRRTVYVLTNRRLAVLCGGSTVDIRSVLPEMVQSLSRKEGPDGRGTLTLSLGTVRDSDGDRVEKTETLGVIHEVRKVEELVRGWMARAN